jgi:predicted MFS family arabinose efflux permease
MTAGGSPVALPPRVAAAMFASFAFAYFFSALVRGVTATLAPHFSRELGLGSAELGLLAGAYFVGFAAMQLPMGSALDRFGPRRVLLALMTLAVIGCLAFARAPDFAALTLARALIGVGVSACLMAPMTAFRRHFMPAMQMRASAWMLMTGSLGMVASTLPVDWLLPVTGWRGLFVVVGALMAVAMLALSRWVPADAPAGASRQHVGSAGYAAVFRHPTFVRYAPIGFFHYGGMIAVQSLWAGPWMVDVGGASARQSAQGLFGINVAMLVAFMAWGSLVPRLEARGWSPARLIAWGAPVSVSTLVAIVVLGPAAGAALWALFCVTSTVVSLSLPEVGRAFRVELAGRGLSAYNLVVFAGVFALQWGIGIALDVLRDAGWSTASAYRGAFALFAACCVCAYLWFLGRPPRTSEAARPLAG